jgi:hypothetical protein
MSARNCAGCRASVNWLMTMALEMNVGLEADSCFAQLKEKPLQASLQADVGSGNRDVGQPLEHHRE